MAEIQQFGCFIDQEGIGIRRHQAAGTHEDSDSSVSSYLYIINFNLLFSLYYI